jgi:hypothetical protein
MKIVGVGDTTFILLSGIIVPKNIALSENVELLTADTSHLDLMTAISACSQPDDIAVAAAFIPRISAQFKITASTPKELAAIAWNSSWDALLLSTIFHTELGFNLQSDTEASKITTDSNLRATNYHMHGLTNKSSHVLTQNELDWIVLHFDNAKQLLENDRFQTAVHCLASYRWHSMPRIKMAVLWAGIEGMFGASSEIRFRISLYIARFLNKDDPDARQVTFDAVKKLYNSRSSAVHGSKIKGDLNVAVKDSAEILHKLIRQCIVNKSMPVENELIP